MNYSAIASLFSFLLFIGMLSLLEAGRRFGNWRIAHDPKGARAGTGPLEGSVFALLGLLIAFTFSGAASRFDERRNLIIEEANDIGTAYLRIDLLPAEEQPLMRDLFRRYLDARLEVYRRLRDIETATTVPQALAKSSEIQGEIWKHAVAAGQKAGASPDATKLLLPALNAMFDISAVRSGILIMHPPFVIYAMLFGLALTSALLGGYGMASGKSRNLLHMVSYALAIAAAVYVISDLEFPRRGLVRVDDFDQFLVDLRANIKDG